MFLKRRLRRAFRKASPDALEQILAQCPPKEKSPQTGARPSSARLREWMATAGAVALLLTTGGGLAWFIAQGGSLPAGSSASEVPEPDSSAPSGTEAIHWIELISQEEAAQIAFHSAFPDLTEDIDCYDITWQAKLDKERFLYEVTLEHDAVVYFYEIEAEWGEILSCDSVAYDCIAKMDARDVAMLHAQAEQLEDLEYLNIQLDLQGETPSYLVTFGWENTRYQVRIDARTSDLLELNKVYLDLASPDGGMSDVIGCRKARDLALEAIGGRLDTMIRLEYTFTGDTYEITLSCGGVIYTVCVDAWNAEVQSVTPEPKVPEEEYPGILSAEEVMTIAVVKINDAVFMEKLGAGVAGYGCLATLRHNDIGLYYETVFWDPYFCWQYLQDAYTGEFLAVAPEAESLTFTSEFLDWEKTQSDNNLYTVIRSAEKFEACTGITGRYDEDYFADHTVICINWKDTLTANFCAQQVSMREDGSCAITITIPGTYSPATSYGLLIVEVDAVLDSELQVIVNRVLGD